MREGDKTLQEQATELSEEGMFFETEILQPKEERHPERLWADGREQRFEAKVLYRSANGGCKQGWAGLGVKFVKILPEDRIYLRNCILRQINMSKYVI